MSRIDERSVVPLGWVLGLFSTGILITIVGAFWVATVNFRLQRIEQKLGIPPVEMGSAPSPIAEAYGEGAPLRGLAGHRR